MKTFAATLYRDLTCGMAAALITLVLGVTFVHSTSVPAAGRSALTSVVAIGPLHGWFGQPQPAVLVD